MSRIFRIDGPAYKLGSIMYFLIVTNFLWLIFSLPLFTIGASTTALYYVTGKLTSNEDVSIFKDFLRSFKLNFKQGSILGTTIFVSFLVLLFNILYYNKIGSIGQIILPVQIAFLFELLAIAIFIFPILSRYDMSYKDLIKTSFIISNRYLLRTICCIILIIGILLLLYRFLGLMVLFPVSLYVLLSYLVMQSLFKTS